MGGNPLASFQGCRSRTGNGMSSWPCGSPSDRHSNRPRSCMKGRAAFTFVCSPFGLAGLGLIWECSSRKDWDETGQQHVSVCAYPSVAPECSLNLQRALRWGTRRRVVLVDEAFSNIALKPPKEFNLLDNKQYCYKTWKTRGRGLPDKEKGMPGNSEGACQARDGAS
ncbi:uncharacterized protein RBU33_012370 isoform 1-T12 [Hipposideros larvatus]